MTRFSRPELAALALDLSRETEEVLEQDGPRNAALFWSRARTAARFRDTPPAFAHAPDIPEAFPTTYSVMEAYRTLLPAAMHDVADSPAEPVTADHAYRAMSQYAAAVQAHAVEAAQAASILFHHVEETTQRCALSC